MSISQKNLWRGLRSEAADALEIRDYGSGRDAIDRIPGVEMLKRKVYAQQHRGYFGELGRNGEGRLGEIGLWPRQWAAAAMFAGSAKGFHIHPPHVPEGVEPEAWFRKLYVEEPERFDLRPYDLEQWDVMFFLTGRVEMLLVDERAGMERRKLRCFIDGDNHRGANNVAVVIPAGVAHALRVEGSEDAVMVYGTSTTFDPANEGRLFSGIETAVLPADWDAYFNG